MPLTPLHAGPGLLIKSLAGRYFSLLTFLAMQGIMDLEVLVRMGSGAAVWHGYSNTLWGATLIALVSVPVCLKGWPGVARYWNRHWPHTPLPARLPAVGAWIGGGLGVYSHWWLDALMHADAQPLAPWRTDNPFLGGLRPDTLDTVCVVTAGLGAVVWGLGRLSRR